MILQFNFESGVSRTEFGKLLVGGDYWISNPGPSDRFERIANVARENGTKVSAKIQTGNSHEVASVPFVPVPSLLYRKFSAMRSLGCLTYHVVLVFRKLSGTDEQGSRSYCQWNHFLKMRMSF